MTTTEETTGTATPPAGVTIPEAKKPDTRDYLILHELELAVGTDEEKAAAAEKLASLAYEGNITVYVRTGRANAQTQEAAVKSLGQHVELDGDYDVVAQTSVKRLGPVKTKKETTVSIG